ncbi:MAG TPA: hydrogenase maturation protease, partial [Pseudomonadales bacterium]|nr:hydrogenase maturation protease [Pseudomonadales bacterium]
IERLKDRAELPAEVTLVDGGTIGFTLLEPVEAARTLIIVDAMKTDDAPGTVHIFADEALDEFLAAPTQRSVHDANVGDVLRMSALRGTLPPHRILVGITAEDIGWNTTPSQAVVRGIETACSEIKRIIEEDERWQS